MNNGRKKMVIVFHTMYCLYLKLQLNERAQQLAKSLSKKGEEEVFEKDIPYGENIYVGFARDLNWKMQPEEPVQYWLEFYATDIDM